MKAVTEWARQQKVANVTEGWLVTGASKRGYTSYMIGGATCKDCVPILGIAPMVPIMPSLQAEMHRQW